MATKLYLHATTSGLPSGTLPNAEQSTLTSGDNAEGSQTTNRLMDTAIGTTQASIANTSLGTISATNYYFSRWVSPKVVVSTIDANTWTWNFAAQESAAQANFPVSGTAQPVYVNCYVWKTSNGTKTGTILDGNTASNYNEASTTGGTAEHGTFSGSQVTGVTANDDIIVIEAWFQVTQANTTTRTQTFFYDGTTENTTTGAAVTNHASFLETPQDLFTTRVTQSSILKYNIIGRIVQTSIIKYNIVGRVLQSTILKYHILERITKSAILKYNLIGRVAQSSILKYNIIGRIVRSSILKYNIVGRVSQNVILKYNLVARAVRSTIIKYNIVAENLERVTQSIIIKYNLIGRIVRSFIAKYNLAARTASTMQLKYHLAGRVVRSTILKYNVLSNNLDRVTQSVILRYSLRQRINNLFIVRYRIKRGPSKYIIKAFAKFPHPQTWTRPKVFGKNYLD